MTSLNNTSSSLEQSDTKLTVLLMLEKIRQESGLDLIASENYTSAAVLQALSSTIHNKYSEGLPGARLYGGNQFIDLIEILAKERSLEAFHLDPEEWGVNVQPYSGSSANIAVHMALLQTNDRILGIDLPDSGHLTFGYFAPTRIPTMSVLYQSVPFTVDTQTNLLDYEQLEMTAKTFPSKLIVAGSSSSSRCLDYKKLKQIANTNNAYLMADISQIAGMIAAQVIPSPFEYADVVCTTTHTTLRGPRAGIIFYRKGIRETKPNGEQIMFDLEDRINAAVYPGLQGGPHFNTIAAVATCMLEATLPQFIEYQKQVLKNAKCLSKMLQFKGYEIVTGGTDLNMFIIDLRNLGLTGASAEKILDEVNIYCNRCAIPYDNAISGIKLGTAAITTRGLIEKDMVRIADFIDRALRLASHALKKPDYKNLTIEEKYNLEDFQNFVQRLGHEIQKFSSNALHPLVSEF